MSLVLFGSSQSATFECKFMNSDWSTLDLIYWCDVQNAVNITSLDAVNVDSISGTHLDGYNNDNVEAFWINYKGQIHYFPRNLNKFFKNLKGIAIYNTGLKEVHQSDLKDFPKLMNLYLFYNNLEIIEENLFKFNPNLDLIELSFNKISHIDPNVFDKKAKLRSLNLGSNTCINMAASNNLTVVQNVIKTANVQCKNSEYSNLEQKVKNLLNESEDLNADTLKTEIEILENEIKNSKFPNFFQQQIQDLKAVQVKKEEEEANETTEAPTTTTTTEDPKESETCISRTCSALESNVNAVAESLKDLGATIEDKLENISNAIMIINQNYEEQNKRFLNLMNALENVFSAVH